MFCSKTTSFTLNTLLLLRKIHENFGLSFLKYSIIFITNFRVPVFGLVYYNIHVDWYIMIYTRRSIAGY